MTKRLWAVIHYTQTAGEWTGHIKMSTVHKKVAETFRWKMAQETGLGPTELVVRKVAVEVPSTPIAEVLLMAETVHDVRDILTEARLTYHEASPGTKRKWERAARAREMALNRAEAGSRLVSLDSKLDGGPRLLGPDGRPVTA